MARKKNDNTPEIVSDELPQSVVGTVADDQNTADEHSSLVVSQFGEGLPYSRTHYIAKCKSHLARSAEEAMHAGRCLVVMKECEPHGEWLTILDEIGLDRTLASRMMHAAIKLSNVAAPQHLIDAAKSKTKLFELMVLDDAQLDQMGDGGTVMGLMLDDIDRMTSRELKAALRESKEQVQAKDQILSDKNARIDDLSTQLAKMKRRIKSMSTEEAAREIRKEVAEVAYDAEVGITANLRAAFSALDEHGVETGIDHLQHMAMLMNHLALALAAVRDEFSIPVVDHEQLQAWHVLLGAEGIDAQGE